MKELSRHEKALCATNDFTALIAAGWTTSALVAAGWTPSALIAAGWTTSALREEMDKIPILNRPYSQLWNDIKDKKRVFNQSTFGNCGSPEENICGSAMCTAGHLVNMAGQAGYDLKKRYGYAGAANIIHHLAHPDWPCQNFGNIPTEWALAYIEEMAEREQKEGE